MKTKIYIDTSILGGYFDAEFNIATEGFFDKIREKAFEVYISEITEIEILPAPNYVQDLLSEIPTDCLFRLQLTQDIKDLAEAYISENALTSKSMNDAFHIALASVNRLDVLVSWNFKHIVNYNRIRLFNAVNLRLGYPTIDIRSPLEFI